MSAHWLMVLADFEVTGRVMDSSGKPVSNLVIQAFDSDQSWYEDRNDDLVGMDRTKNDGSFRVSFSDKYSRETLERNPDLYLVIRDSVGTVLQKTEVRKEVKPTDKKQLNFDVTLSSQERQDSDIYAGNMAKTIAAFSGISDRVDLPSDIRGTFLTLLKTINAWTLYTREEMWDRIGYDGPQVGRYPWREPHDHKLGWKK